MFSKVDYIMINVSEMSRSVAFYRDALGLSLKFESPGWSEFDSGATTLALHHASGGGNENRGSQKPGAGTGSIGFSVQDLDATYKNLSAKGVKFVLPPMDQPNEGIRLAVCIDPDGFSISFAQPIGNQGR